MESLEHDGDVLISIIIPVYNTSERYLRQCFASMSEAQDSRLEIIVVDDGSRTETADLLDRLARESVNTMRVIHKENSGQSSARNVGVQASCGVYVEFVDSDDYIDWDAQQRILAILSEHRPDILRIGVVKGAENGTILEQPEKNDGSYRDIDKCAFLLDCSAMWQQLIRRSLFKTSGIRQCEDIRIGEDFASITSLGLAAETIGKAYCDLYHFINHNSSITHQPHPEMLLDILTAMEFIREQAKRLDVYERFHDEIEYQAIVQVVHWGVMRALDWAGPRSEAIPRLFGYIDKTFPKWRDNHYYAERDKSSLQFRLIVGGHYRTYLVLRQLRELMRRVRDIRN